MRPNNQSGNAFILILAGVVLFAALMFTFTKSGQKGTGNLSKNQAKIAAQEILSYAQLVEGAVDRVRRNGCSENEINFNNAVVSGYSNTSAPPDGSCDIFSTSGGKISTFEIAGITNKIGFFIALSVEGIGSSEKELIWTDGIDETICLEINNLLDIPNPSGSLPGTDASTWTNFTGDFSAGAAAGTDNGSVDGITEIEGKSTACYNNDGNAPIFYHVLLVR